MGPKNWLVIFSKPWNSQGCQILVLQGCQIFICQFISIKIRVGDIKVGKPPYFGSRKQSMIFLKPYSDLGCHILLYSVARYIIFSIYFQKIDEKEIEIDITPKFRQRNRLIIFFKFNLVTWFRNTGSLYIIYLFVQKDHPARPLGDITQGTLYINFIFIKTIMFLRKSQWSCRL